MDPHAHPSLHWLPINELCRKKPVFWVSDQVGHKPGSTATEDRGLKVRKKRDCTTYVA